MIPRRRWRVTIRGRRIQTWSTYDSDVEAHRVVQKLRQHGFDAEAVCDDDPPEAPEHRNERRAFLVWACMLGAVPPERIVERVLEDIASEATR